MSTTPNPSSHSSANAASFAKRQRDSISGDSSLVVSSHYSKQQHLQHHHGQQQSNNANRDSDRHPILRVASAHGSRDCVNLLPYHTAIGQQRQQFYSSLVRSTPAPSDSLEANQIEQPPLYHQAVQDFAKFTTYRKSPESRAIQAVQPFGKSELLSSLPTVIPNECQVVKQLVREVVANKLAGQSSVSVPFFVQQSIGATVTSPPNSASGPFGPPSYASYQQQANSQQVVHELQKKQTSFDQSYQLQNAPTSTISQNSNNPKTMANDNPSTIGQTSVLFVSKNNNQSPNSNTLRMSLSHSDLSRLQNLVLAPAPSSLQNPQQQTQITKMHPLLAAQQQNVKTQLEAMNNARQSNSTNLDANSFVPQQIQVLQSPITLPNMTSISSSSNRQLDSLLDSSTYLQYLNLQRQQRQHIESSQHQPHRSPVNANFTNLDFIEHAQRGASGIITVLAEENNKLRTDLESSTKKALKLHQLELQYQKISRDYDDLARKQEKREQLEQQMHKTMQAEMSNLTDINNNLNDQVELYYSQIDSYQAENVELRQEMERLASQNKELFAIKERQEIELEAQRATLEEQRSHIVILDKALSNAQEKVLKLDEECKKRSSTIQRCEQLQQEVNTLREAVQKRDDLYRRNTAQLQKEIAQLRVLKKESKKSNSTDIEDVSVTKLKRELQEKENQIYNFQQESEQWQKLYNDEIQRKEVTIEELSDAKNARIKSLEEVNSKSEKRVEELENKLKVAEARYNILKRQSQASNNTGLMLPSHESSFVENSTSKSALYGGVPDLMDGSKKRLEAVHRILQNPSTIGTYRYSAASGGANPAAGLYQRHHNKFTSVDSSFAAITSSPSSYLKKSDFGHEYGSLGRKSSGLLGTSSGLSSALKRVNIGSSLAASELSRHSRAQSSCDAFSSSIYLPASATTQRLSATAPLAHRQLFTLPARCGRNKVPLLDEGKLNRPRSADDHLFSRDDSDEDILANENNFDLSEKLENDSKVRHQKMMQINNKKKLESLKSYGTLRNEENGETDDGDEKFDFESNTIKRGAVKKLVKNRKIADKLNKFVKDNDEELFDV